MAPVEVWTLQGLRTFMVLFANRHHSRKVEILGITDAITDEFSTNAAKNLLDVDAKPMTGITHLILDRDAKFTPAFKTFVERAGVKIMLTPPRSPDCNSICERWVGTIRRELLNRMIFFGEGHLRAAVSSFVRHYHSERSHQSFENAILEPGDEVGREFGRLERRDHLGGILRYYYRKAG